MLSQVASLKTNSNKITQQNMEQRGKLQKLLTKIASSQQKAKNLNSTTNKLKTMCASKRQLLEKLAVRLEAYQQKSAEMQVPMWLGLRSLPQFAWVVSTFGACAGRVVAARAKALRAKLASGYRPAV